MNQRQQSVLAKLPSVDSALSLKATESYIEQFGRAAVTNSIRQVIATLRKDPSTLENKDEYDIAQAVVKQASEVLAESLKSSLQAVINLSGTVLHTNLGRAALPEPAIEAMVAVAKSATNLEFNLDNGKRGKRDDHIENLLCQLTGAEAATVVNNNAAAVLVALNSLAIRKEVIVSRGELIEIGGAFRIPDIMTRAGAKLKEVGTTNRTHLKDYEQAISSKSALMLKVHTSNYRIEGFTASVSEKNLAELSKTNESEHSVPVMVDLGSGTLTDLTAFGLPREPTAGDSIKAGVNIVTFSGDKLLGGPQAGLIVGDKVLIDKIKKNPMTRALRVDKIRLAALEAVLRLYLFPDKLAESLPVIKTLTKPLSTIQQQAQVIAKELNTMLPESFSARVEDCLSAIGSGSLPGEVLQSQSVVIATNESKRKAGKSIRALESAFRQLPVPIIGRITNEQLHFDLRCLDESNDVVNQLPHLSVLLRSVLLRSAHTQ